MWRFLVADCHSLWPRAAISSAKAREDRTKISHDRRVVTCVAARKGSNIATERGKKKKKERKERERGKKRDKIATPLPVGGVEAPVEAPVQSSWHTYELCIRCSLCVIARCIIIPGEKVSVTIPSGTRYPWNRWKNAGWRPIQRMGIVTMRIEIEIISNRK